MSKKILVIEDEWVVTGKIYNRIHGKLFGGCSQIDTQQAYRIIKEMFAVLAEHELDVIEFEAKIKAKNLGAGYTAGPYRIEIPQNIKLKLGEYYQVLVLKSKKPEGKHEKENASRP